VAAAAVVVVVVAMSARFEANTPTEILLTRLDLAPPPLTSVVSR
jgi:hypothetical protein